MIYDFILQKIAQGKRLSAFLLDPDAYTNGKIEQVITLINTTSPDIILVGGSLLFNSTQSLVTQLKKSTSQPIILFPGSPMQLTPEADAVLLLSLISGRNPELLIGHHVMAAPIIKQMEIEPISTGYLLIDGGKTTSVEYISQTQPIPADKIDIAVATAMAGEMLGMKMIYLEGGSGAQNPVPQKMISAVKNSVKIPVIVGGGINSVEKVKNALLAGADLIVFGNAIEKEPALLEAFVQEIRQYS